MSDLVNLQRERAVRRPIVFDGLGEALHAAQVEVLLAKRLTDSALLLDSEDVLDHLAAIQGILRACQRHVNGQSPGSHGSTT